MSEPNDDSSVALLLRARSGDDDARDRLIARHLPRLERWASGRLPWGLRSMLDTGDLVQDAVVSALPHLKHLEIRSEHVLQFYLRQAIRNRIIDLHKRSLRRPARAELADEVAAPGESPLDAAIGAEAMERYERALSAMKKEDRQAIVLRVELGLNYEEIATHLEKPTADAARMAVTRAIAKLADKMGRHGRRVSDGHEG